MDDLISRQAAIRLITGYNGVMDKSVAKRLLIQMPPAQPERIRGKWIDDTYCSECGWVHTVEPGFIGSVKGFNYCPNCGADMRIQE